MKRRDLIRHLETHGCEFLREGGNHTVYVNRALKKTSTVPKHKEINEFLVYKICKDLGSQNRKCRMTVGNFRRCLRRARIKKTAPI
ncbi:MAG: hypothetical protein BROFUL_00099 [Candidatus Brocadia fulgida]|uniref:YcfA-like protein n=1 Tax=Candidatus Brocadia fulgida TaxID=380242 RepID=A0A0M2UZZ8_9BACT|nr:MAG: hypothetical protein BROFUL_00099 [Candidatus Brocadia fulgida]